MFTGGIYHAAMAIPVLSGEEVLRALPMERAIEAARRAFLAQARGEGAAPQRISMPVQGSEGSGTTLVMPVHLPGAALVTKVVSVYPGNPARGQQTIQGLVLVLDESTGAPLAILDAPTLTGLRTGAASAVATDLLGPRDARVLGLVGCGVQGWYQALGQAKVRPLESIRLWSRDRGRAELLGQKLAGRLGIEAVVVSEPPEAARGAQLVCMATPASTPLLGPEDLPERCHVNAIGSFRADMMEFAPGICESADVWVDDPGAVLEESGELIAAIQSGMCTQDQLRPLAGLVQGTVEAGSSRRSLFKSVGFGLLDAAAAAAVLGGPD